MIKAFIVHRGREVLMEMSAGRISFPHLPDTLWSFHVREFVMGTREIGGYHVAIFRRVSDSIGGRIVIAEVIEDRFSPRGELSGSQSWVPIDAALEILEPSGAKAVADALHMTDAAPTHWQHLPPWYAHGWQSTLTCWIDTELSSRGASRTGPVFQTRHSPISCVVQTDSSLGPLICKATPDSMKHEAMILRLLADILPASTPRVLSADPHHGWVLMKAFEPAEGPSNILHDCLQTVRCLAHTQLACIDRTAELIAKGCPQRSIVRLVPDLEEMLSPGGTIECWYRAKSSMVRNNLDRIKESCLLLASSSLPETLIHSDLHPGNVCRTDDGIVLFDWADSCIAHPLVDLEPILWHLGRRAGDAGEAIIQEFVAVWAASTQKPQIRLLFDSGRMAGIAHQVLTYGRLLKITPDDEKPLWIGFLDRWVEELQRRADMES